MDGDSWLSWIPIVFLLCMAAYFAVAETAATSVSRIRLKTRLDQGDQKAKKALYVQDNFDRAISAILIGTNIVHISTATLTTVLVTRTWGASWVALGTIVCTIAVFFAGEMLPKSIAKRYSERCALATAPSLCFFMRIFAPLAKALSHIGEFFSNLAKGEPEITVTEDELYDIIETMTDEGELPEDRAELVHSALEFADVTVERVFTPRVDVAALDVNTPPEKILSFIREQRHSRLPVYEGSIDNIIGVLQIRKYVRVYLRERKYPELRSLLDAPCFVHQSTSIDELLEELNRQKVSLAVVTDNYGGTMGIVTVEDIIEELVGEIWDEHDEEEVFIRKIGEDKETIYVCYVTSAKRKLEGVVTVKDLLLSDDDVILEDIMDTNVIYASTTDDQEEVSDMISNYDLIAIPVVDKEGCLVGIVTVDDIIDVMEQEATEDIEKMAGITPSDKPYSRTSVVDIWKNRIPWLMFLMLSATFTGMIVTHFEDALATQVALASFMPMLMGTGGNSGSQSSVTIIRSLSLAEIRFSDIFRIMFKEMRVALLCGATLAVVNFGKLMLFDRLGVFVSLTVSLTLLATVVVAKFFGCTLPLLVKKIGLDPAVMASPIITTIVDAIALLIYFAIASAMLGI